MLPDPQYLPTCLGESAIGVAVALDVALKLGPPPIAAGPRPASVLRAGVPEATVDEDGKPLASKNDIGTTSKTGKWQSKIHSVPKAASIEFAAQSEFWLRVRPSLPEHPATGFL